LIQGVSELFPISSLGHAVVAPRLFGWNIHQNDKYFLTFLVAVHLATAIVLLFFFWKDWVRVFKGIGRSLRDREIAADDRDAKLGWLLVVGTIPAGILGLTLESPLRKVFASPESAAIFIFINGLLLFGAEALRRRAPDAPETERDEDNRIAERLSWRQSVGVGASQALALIPGISRSGVTMGGGLLVGLNNEDAAKFAFLLATPIIGAAAALKLPELFGSAGNGVRGPALVAALCAGVTAFFSIRFLMRFFETNRLTPFAIYCTVVGAALAIGFAVT
jgi:undecaprenyl-diphosphatase